MPDHEKTLAKGVEASPKVDILNYFRPPAGAFWRLKKLPTRWWKFALSRARREKN
ncbi:MAG: hypothetical protein LBK12_08575 [Odoribacteraceae bacterium]|jgi:hypothetical protein|nr:hypothetical protein [Odoribacteraceae bacterium]